MVLFLPCLPVSLSPKNYSGKLSIAVSFTNNSVMRINPHRLIVFQPYSSYYFANFPILLVFPDLSFLPSYLLPLLSIVLSKSQIYAHNTLSFALPRTSHEEQQYLLIKAIALANMEHRFCKKNVRDICSPLNADITCAKCYLEAPQEYILAEAC